MYYAVALSKHDLKPSGTFFSRSVAGGFPFSAPGGVGGGVPKFKSVGGGVRRSDPEVIRFFDGFTGGVDCSILDDFGPDLGSFGILFRPFSGCFYGCNSDPEFLRLFLLF